MHLARCKYMSSAVFQVNAHILRLMSAARTAAVAVARNVSNQLAGVARPRASATKLLTSTAAGAGKFNRALSSTSRVLPVTDSVSTSNNIILLSCLDNECHPVFSVNRAPSINNDSPFMWHKW